MCQKRHAKKKIDRKKGPAVKPSNSTRRVGFLLNQFLFYFSFYLSCPGFKAWCFFDVHHMAACGW